MKVTADGRYILFVNGVRVGRGPVRCNPLYQRYDEYDLAPYLHAGRNVFAVLAHVYVLHTSPVPAIVLGSLNALIVYLRRDEIASFARLLAKVL